MELRGWARVPAWGQLCQPLAGDLAAAAGHQEVRVGRQDRQCLVRTTQEGQGKLEPLVSIDQHLDKNSINI